MKQWLFILIALCVNHAWCFELIAHRGVHQIYHREGLTNKTCTAKRINNIEHPYQENTLESIEAAFNHHADVVEIDIHPTTEPDNALDELVVFHDWSLNCRTNATCDTGCRCNKKNKCLTHQQSLKYLQMLDIGHGYTHDGGKTYPFRGQYFAKMPAFSQVLELLKKYPDKKILVNIKGNRKRSVKAFLRIINDYPQSIRERLYFPGRFGFATELKEMSVGKDIIQADKVCFKQYILTGWLGIFPDACRNKKIMVPVKETLERFHKSLSFIKLTSLLWGWPEDFIERANKHGTSVYASQVDTINDYHALMALPLAGIMTNKIEIIGDVHDKYYFSTTAVIGKPSTTQR